MEYTQDQIPSQDREELCQALSLQHTDDLPEKLVDEYWSMKRVADRMNMRVNGAPLLMLLYQLGYGKPTSSELSVGPLADLYKQGDLKSGDTVVVVWRNQDKLAVLRSIAGDTALVLIEGQDKEREIPLEKVTLAELATA